MKKKFTKFMAFFLFCTCILSVGLTQKANATVDNTYGWAFGITGVDDSNGYALSKDSNGNYKLKDNSVLVITGFYSSTGHGYSSYYVYLDNVYIGSQTSPNIFYDYWTSNGAYYNVMNFKNLTPGTHTIQVKCDRPWDIYSGPAQKKDTISVIAPAVTTSSAVTVTP